METINDCWQQIEMSGFVANELSAFSTPVLENGHRLFLVVLSFLLIHYFTLWAIACQFTGAMEDS